MDGRSGARPAVRLGTRLPCRPVPSRLAPPVPARIRRQATHAPSVSCAHAASERQPAAVSAALLRGAVGRAAHPLPRL